MPRRGAPALVILIAVEHGLLLPHRETLAILLVQEGVGRLRALGNWDTTMVTEQVIPRQVTLLVPGTRHSRVSWAGGAGSTRNEGQAVGYA